VTGVAIFLMIGCSVLLTSLLKVRISIKIFIFYDALFVDFKKFSYKLSIK